MTVHEVSELAHISVRTLHHYDRIGLLRPSKRSESGYRLYCEDDLLRLQQILLYRELEFPLADIKRILESPDFDRDRALGQQIELLSARREHIDGLIALAASMREKGETHMGFEAFDTKRLDEQEAAAKAAWGKTAQWAEYEEKSAGKTEEDKMAAGERLMELFVPLGAMAAAGVDPASQEAREQVAAIQDFITEHFYTCTNEVLGRLGQMYGSGGEFTQNIDAAAGPGTAAFAAQAVRAYCER